MNEPPIPETYISVLAPPNGTALLFQGYRKAALFLKRENVSRFIDDPHATGVLVIPPFAALALHCFLAAESTKAIHLEQDLAISEDYSITVRLTSGSGIRYVSSHDKLDSARALVRDNVKLVITPKLLAMVHSGDDESYLSRIVELPHEEEADYANRFVHETLFLVEALQRATAARTNTLLL